MKGFDEFAESVRRHGLTVFEYHRNLVKLGTFGVSDDDMDKIAHLVTEARKRGDANVSVKHVFAAYSGQECDCYQCVVET